NINYLGRAGVRQIFGLTVAFLDGTYDKAAFHAPSTATTGSPTRRHYTQEMWISFSPMIGLEGVQGG
ncbi:hypothetical protein WJX84_000746, partial [Apatococcus fuscideae]